MIESTKERTSRSSDLAVKIAASVGSIGLLVSAGLMVTNGHIAAERLFKLSLLRDSRFDSYMDTTGGYSAEGLCVLTAAGLCFGAYKYMKCAFGKN